MNVHGTPQFLRVNWANCPPFIKSRYSPSTPLFRAASRVVIEWRGYGITLEPGGIVDLASIPWLAGLVGITRHNSSNWMDLGAWAHDLGYMGARFPGKRSNWAERRLWDDLKLDLWIYSKGGSKAPKFRNFFVRIFGWRSFERDSAQLAAFRELDWIKIEEAK